MQFVAKSKEDPDNIKKAKVVTYDIFIPPYLLVNTMSGPIMRKKWTEFVSQKLLHLFNKCGIVSNEEMKKMENANVSDIWDGRIETLLHANRRALLQLQKDIEDEFSKHPEGSISSNEEERNKYIVCQYKNRVEVMNKNGQVDFHLDDLTENESIFGKQRLMKCLFFSSTEYQLENPLWQYVNFHLYKGPYQTISKMGTDRRFNLYIPYMFEEDELIDFLRLNLIKLMHIMKSKDVKKLM